MIISRATRFEWFIQDKVLRGAAHWCGTAADLVPIVRSLPADEAEGIPTSEGWLGQRIEGLGNGIVGSMTRERVPVFEDEAEQGCLVIRRAKPGDDPRKLRYCRLFVIYHVGRLSMKGGRL